MLGTRGLPFEVPAYSLTGDILAFQRCPLQYRYYNGSSLPPSRPVQMWTGEFIHGVLEEAYRYWQIHRPAFPWPYTEPGWPPVEDPPNLQGNDIGRLGQRVEIRLAAGGKTSRNRDARLAAYGRVRAAINILGEHLFPLITAAEERISGTREMPAVPAGQAARGDRYELTGIVDVISSVMLGQQTTNPIVRLIQASLPATPAGEYDVIVDYKGLRRPPIGSQFRSHFEWQVQTYAWLRGQMPGVRTVGAGVLIFVNELEPSRGDIEELQHEMLNGTADVVPANGTQDYYAIHGYSPQHAVPNLTLDFRLRRAIKVIDVASNLLATALGQIDAVVAQIESSAFVEHNTGNIPSHWQACGGANDCVACDFVHFCPSPHGHRAPADPPKPLPSAPG
jgi:hypothetical protein